MFGRCTGCRLVLCGNAQNKSNMYNTYAFIYGAFFHVHESIYTFPFPSSAHKSCPDMLNYLISCNCF